MPQAPHPVLRQHPLLLVLLMVNLVLVRELAGVARAQGREFCVVSHYWGVQWLRDRAVRRLTGVLHDSEAWVEPL